MTDSHLDLLVGICLRWAAFLIAFCATLTLGGCTTLGADLLSCPNADNTALWTYVELCGVSVALGFIIGVTLKR